MQWGYTATDSNGRSPHSNIGSTNRNQRTPDGHICSTDSDISSAYTDTYPGNYADSNGRSADSDSWYGWFLLGGLHLP